MEDEPGWKWLMKRRKEYPYLNDTLKPTFGQIFKISMNYDVSRTLFSWANSTDQDRMSSWDAIDACIFSSCNLQQKLDYKILVCTIFFLRLAYAN